MKWSFKKWRKLEKFQKITVIMIIIMKGQINTSIQKYSKGFIERDNLLIESQNKLKKDISLALNLKLAKVYLIMQSKESIKNAKKIHYIQQKNSRTIILAKHKMPDFYKCSESNMVKVIKKVEILIQVNLTILLEEMRF